MELSVIYPAYNESENLASTIERTIEAVAGAVSSFEIIVIDDCSRDDTGAIAERLATEHPELRVVHNEVNLGQGGSLHKAFGLARGDWVIHNGVDYPFDFADLPLLLDRRGQADIVVAERGQRPGYTVYRVLLSYANIMLLNLLFPLHLRDYSFVQLYRRECLRKIHPMGRSTGFFIPETLLRANDVGCRVVAVPITYHAREAGVATAGRLSVVLASFADVFRYWWWRLRHRQEAKSFT